MVNISPGHWNIMVIYTIKCTECLLHAFSLSQHRPKEYWNKTNKWFNCDNPSFECQNTSMDGGCSMPLSIHNQDSSWPNLIYLSKPYRFSSSTWHSRFIKGESSSTQFPENSNLLSFYLFLAVWANCMVLVDITQNWWKTCFHPEQQWEPRQDILEYCKWFCAV